MKDSDDLCCQGVNKLKFNSMYINGSISFVLDPIIQYTAFWGCFWSSFQCSQTFFAYGLTKSNWVLIIFQIVFNYFKNQLNCNLSVIWILTNLIETTLFMVDMKIFYTTAFQKTLLYLINVWQTELSCMVYNRQSRYTLLKRAGEQI
jgi:hypothetical protein